jgi:hypothetical protein
MPDKKFVNPFQASRRVGHRAERRLMRCKSCDSPFYPEARRSTLSTNFNKVFMIDLITIHRYYNKNIILRVATRPRLQPKTVQGKTLDPTAERAGIKGIDMGRKLILILLFSIIAYLVAGYYGVVSLPWLDEGTDALSARNEFVNKSDKILKSNPD